MRTKKARENTGQKDTNACPCVQNPSNEQGMYVFMKKFITPEIKKIVKNKLK